MSWRRGKTSHKTRLFLITTGSVGLVLAIVFIGIVLGVRQKVVAHKEAEMRLAVRTSIAAHGGKLDLVEFRSLYPGYSVAVFDASGKKVVWGGPIQISPVLGFQDMGSHVFLGERVGDEHVVVGSGWTSAEQGLDTLAAILGGLWLPITLLVGAATWLGAQSVFRPLERLSHQAAAISGSNLKERLAIQDRAEFGDFA